VTARPGIGIPFLRALSVADTAEVARAAEGAGFAAAWTGEAAGPDAVTTLAVVAGATGRLGVAAGVVPVQTRTPVVLGMTAATLGHVAPGRVVLGLGLSSQAIVADWNGLRFSHAVAQVREAVEIVRRVLTGDRVTYEGTWYRCRGFRLAIPPPPAPVRIYLAALGPRMLELAGEIADGVLLNWIAPEAVPAALRHLEAGARRAGRTLAGFDVAAFVRTAVTDAPDEARGVLGREITGYAIVDAYARFFAGCGYGAEVEAVTAAWRAGDRAGAVRQVSRRVLDGLGVVGEPDFCRARYAEFARQGVTQPVLIPIALGAEPKPALLRAVRALGPEPTRPGPPRPAGAAA
jgi:probable F420-dependent oxidoreductase